jgi:hypothetical protein
MANVGAPLLLYSTNTSLAYNLNQHYYHGKHWVWCNRHFDRFAAKMAGYAAPPSSIPLDIYKAYSEDIRRGDFHSAYIKQNRIGLLRGAKLKLKAGVIDQAQYGDIQAIIRKAQLSDFSPLIYVIPFAMVKKSAILVAPAKAANPFSCEYQIASLVRSDFDIISP